MPTPVLTPQHRLTWSREEAGLSQQAIADALGVSVRTIGNWERGDWMPPAAYAAWARVCDCEYDWLIGSVPTPSVPTKLERRRRAKSTAARSDQVVTGSRWTGDDDEAQDRVHVAVLAHAA